MADFQSRGFRLDQPARRTVLETHARSFLTGFNLAAANRSEEIHSALSEVAGEERGFAYEGAGMYAGMVDLLTAGRARALARLVSDRGDQYVHLVHVGTGWALAPLRLPLPVRLPATPLFRWLAMDGAGFAEVFFGGVRALRRRSRRGPSASWQARLAGCGRALWFVQSADVHGVAGAIGELPTAAHPHLWSGVGLASAYAGAVDDEERDLLVAASGEHWPHFAQGVVFAVAARVRSGIVPAHTEAASRQLLSTDPDTAASWTDVAARGLTESQGVAAYLEWKTRLRRVIAPHS